MNQEYFHIGKDALVRSGCPHYLIWVPVSPGSPWGEGWGLMYLKLMNWNGWNLWLVSGRYVCQFVLVCCVFDVFCLSWMVLKKIPPYKTLAMSKFHWLHVFATQYWWCLLFEMFFQNIFTLPFSCKGQGPWFASIWHCTIHLERERARVLITHWSYVVFCWAFYQMYYSVIGDGRADAVEWKQQLMQLFFFQFPLRTKETAEQCPALRVAVTLAERRNPSCEVLKRCSARLVTVRDDNFLPTCSETPWQLVIFHILPSFSLVVLTTVNNIFFYFPESDSNTVCTGLHTCLGFNRTCKIMCATCYKTWSFFLLLLSKWIK